MQGGNQDGAGDTEERENQDQGTGVREEKGRGGGWENEDPWLLAGTPKGPFTLEEREPCSKMPLHISLTPSCPARNFWAEEKASSLQWTLKAWEGLFIHFLTYRVNSKSCAIRHFPLILHTQTHSPVHPRTCTLTLMGTQVCTATTTLIYIYPQLCPLKHTQTHTPLPSNPPLTPPWPSTLPYSGPPGALSSLGTAHGALEFQYHSLQKNISAQCTLLGVQFKVWPILRERLDWLYCFQKETYGKKEGWEKCI